MGDSKLGVALIHARPYRPQGKGKIERWFKTVRAQLLTRLIPADTASLEALNRRLQTWVQGEYHHAPHRGLDGRTPLEQWAQPGEDVRFPEPDLDLDDLFLFETLRKVQKDRTVSLNGVVYEVDAILVGEKVTLPIPLPRPGERYRCGMRVRPSNWRNPYRPTPTVSSNATGHRVTWRPMVRPRRRPPDCPCGH